MSVWEDIPSGLFAREFSFPEESLCFLFIAFAAPLLSADDPTAFTFGSTGLGMTVVTLLVNGMLTIYGDEVEMDAIHTQKGNEQRITLRDLEAKLRVFAVSEKY